MSARYAHLPQIGAAINHGTGKKRSRYAAGKVKELHHNYVVTDALTRAGTVRMAAGVHFKLRLPPLDDVETEVHVLAVGEIWGKSATSTKYRTALIRKKATNKDKWDPIEHLDATAFPPPDAVEV